MSSVGAAIARKFAEEGYEVILYDVAPKKIDYIDEMNKKIKVVKGDVTDLSFFLDTARKYEVEGLVHSAILLMGTPYYEYPGWWFDVNLGGVKNALEVARMRDLKFVYISSGIVYGNRPQTDILKEDDPTPAYWPIPEGSPIIQNNIFYMAQKIMGEIMTTTYNNTYGMDTVSTRLGTVWGPGDTHIERMHVAGFALYAILGKKYELREGRDHPRDYVYSKNVAHGVYLAYKVRPLKRRVFNITDGRFVRHQEAIDAVKKVMPDAKINLGPGINTEYLRTVMPWIVGPMDITRARTELGYEPPYNLELAVEDYIGWLRKNPEWITKYSTS
jgi:UDP-glucose 4-epimerase